MTKILSVVAALTIGIAGLRGTALAQEVAVEPIAWQAFLKPYPKDADAQRLLAILRNANKYAVGPWWTTAKKYAAQDGAEYLSFANAVGRQEEPEIRPPSEQCFSLAVSLKLGLYDAPYTGVSREVVTARTIRLVRSIAYRHLANSPGGWGDKWQSAHWAAATGQAGWLLWDQLSPDDQRLVIRMVVHEADRFLDYKVPYYQDRSGKIITPGDTKSEENAWNSRILQVATAMMPRHPHWNAWMAKNIELMLSTYARPSDLLRDDVYHGKPLSAWLNGSNSNEDGTLINHNRVHPDYMVAGVYEFTPVITCILARQEVPKAAFFNCDITYQALTDRKFVPGTEPYACGGPIQPPGGTMYRKESPDTYCPQGNDWGSNRKMNFVLADVLAGAFHLDALSSTKAIEWERLHAEASLAMQQRFTDGRTYGAAGEDTFHAREEWVDTRAASSCLIKWILEQGPVQVTNRSYDAARGRMP